MRYMFLLICDASRMCQNDMLIRILLAVFMMESVELTVTLGVEREAIRHLQ